MKLVQKRAPELPGQLQWMQTGPQTLKQYRGVPVVLFFWTRGCVACLHLLEEVQRWHELYQSKGLQVVGIHAPEYAFEQDEAALKGFLAKKGYRFPVAMDASREAMQTYKNHWRPRVYVLNADGAIVRDDVETLDYVGIEETVREMLRHAGAKGVSKPLQDSQGAAYYTRVPFGFSGGRIANQREIVRGAVQIYKTPGRGPHPQLIGRWRIEKDHVQSAGGQIVLPYQGSSVYVTLDLKGAQRPAQISGQRGAFSRTQAGNDVDFSGPLPLLVPDGARPYHVVSHVDAQEGRLRLDVPEGARLFNYTVMD